MMRIKFLVSLWVMIIPIIGFAQKIKGNKKVVEETRLQNASFTTLHCNAVGEIVIAKAGAENKIIVETDENLQRHIKTELVGNELYISTKEALKYTQCKVTVYNNQLNTIKVNNCGIIKTVADSLVFTNLKITAESTGSIDMDFKCTRLQMEANNIGGIYLKGISENAVLNLNGIGAVSASKFSIGYAETRLSNIASVALYVTGTINIQSHSIVNLKLKGNPVVIKKEIDNSIRFDTIDQ